MAIFNLLSTILGGGALSIPYAFKKCGWLGGLLVLAFSVQISLFSLNLLCTLGRKLGCETYSDVVRKTMGRPYAEVLDCISFGMLFLVIVAFFILIKDISGDIFEFVFFQDSLEHLSPGARSWTLYLITACMFPLMIAKSLHALRHISYVGTFSVLLLLVVILLKAVKANTERAVGGDQSASVARMWALHLTDVLAALPIILIAFLCQFNVVGVYAKLVEPTGAHMHQVLCYTIYSSGLIYLTFGIGGYFIAFDQTRDNILNNFSSRDPSLVVARLGLVLTLMCQTPMVVVPCVDSLLKLVDNARTCWKLHTWGLRYHYILYSDNGNEDQIVAESDIEEEDMRGARHSSEHQPRANRSILTLLLVLLCLFLSENVPGVSTIWTLAGSSLSIVLAFLFPSLAYIALFYRLDGSRRVDGSIIGAFGLLVISLFMILLCTAQTIASSFTWAGKI